MYSFQNIILLFVNNTNKKVLEPYAPPVGSVKGQLLLKNDRLH
jgi:hypothetical protein